MSAPANWTISSVRDALTAKKISARELTDDYFVRIERNNSELNAFLTLSKDRAYKQAAAVDSLVAKGRPLPRLAGVSIAVKYVLSTEGIRTTCGSKILENYIGLYDATAIARLESGGAVILGKKNCAEYA